MDDLTLLDAEAQRVARFFADLMITMAEGGVEGAASAEAVRALWGATSQHSGPGSQLDTEVLVHGLSAVAAALAGQLALERSAAGAPGAGLAEVWHEVGRALDAADDDGGVGLGSG